MTMGWGMRSILSWSPSVATIQPNACSERSDNAKTPHSDERADVWALGTEPENDNGMGDALHFVMVALRGDHPAQRLLKPQR